MYETVLIGIISLAVGSVSTILVLAWKAEKRREK